MDGLKLTEAEFRVVTALDERSRCFLVKQGHASSVCQLNLRGMDDILSVISASTDNIDIMHRCCRRLQFATGSPWTSSRRNSGWKISTRIERVRERRRVLKPWHESGVPTLLNERLWRR